MQQAWRALSTPRRGPRDAPQPPRAADDLLTPPLGNRLLVVEQIGGVGRPPIALLLHLRGEAQRNRLTLHQVQTNLQKAHITRTLIRILDALLWSSHPGAGITALTGWERVIRPASRGAPGTDADLLGPGS
jgi:hypothetical protein